MLDDVGMNESLVTDSVCRYPPLVCDGDTEQKKRDKKEEISKERTGLKNREIRKEEK
jgi:hypothetical protein